MNEGAARREIQKSPEEVIVNKVLLPIEQVASINNWSLERAGEPGFPVVTILAQDGRRLGVIRFKPNLKGIPDGLEVSPVFETIVKKDQKTTAPLLIAHTYDGLAGFSKNTLVALQAIDKTTESHNLSAEAVDSQTVATGLPSRPAEAVESKREQLHIQMRDLYQQMGKGMPPYFRSLTHDYFVLLTGLSPLQVPGKSWSKPKLKYESSNDLATILKILDPQDRLKDFLAQLDELAKRYNELK